MKHARIAQFWVLEDTSGYTARDAAGSNAPISLRLHAVTDGVPKLVAETTYTPKAQGRRQNFRTEIVLELLKRGRVKTGIVVVGTRVARSPGLLKALTDSRVQTVFAVSPDGQDAARLVGRGNASIDDVLSAADWYRAKVKAPDSAAEYWVADLGDAALGGCDRLQCIALSQGGIRDYRRQLILGVASLARRRSADSIATLLGWSRWIRIVDRKVGRREGSATSFRLTSEVPTTAAISTRLLDGVPVRANLKLAAARDQRDSQEAVGDLFEGSGPQGRLVEKPILNVVELFAGAGGMGLGFLLANRASRAYRLLFSGEVHPVYAKTLRSNHDYMRQAGLLPADRVIGDTSPLDLREPASMDRVQGIAREWNGVDVLIGGPPCQGFSNANRNSGSSANPNNRLVDTYLDYVVRLRPKVFVMENVQGILWTQRHSTDSLTVADHVLSRSAAAGYRLYPKLIDSAWFGVPQNRNRFFLVGIHRDLGYEQDAFGKWGPFPKPTHGPSGSRPYVTLREAISDLPKIRNGDVAEELRYKEPNGHSTEFLSFLRRGAPSQLVWDHVVSTHADYVIERYRKIPPGANWSAIADMMTNYADIERTHSNIYRRLLWDQPSITVGHYRKAMLIHPEQHRGLSLREAARLQSFPDWFRFAGNGVKGGMTYKQQQVANAVCPLVARAMANLLLEL